MLAVPTSALAGKGGGKKKDKALVVCKHGCKYRTIQKAVDKAGKTKKTDDTIKVKPGKYVEGVRSSRQEVQRAHDHGHQQEPPQDDPRGQERQGPDGVGTQTTGSRSTDVKNVTIKNMWVRNYATNGVFWNDSDTVGQQGTCQGPAQRRRRLLQPQLRPLHLRLHRGTFQGGEGWGHGDSAYYVGATPFQNEPEHRRS